MNCEEIVCDVFDELPFFNSIWREVSLRRYVSVNHLALVSIGLSIAFQAMTVIK